jgi:hypothetical protein
MQPSFKKPATLEEFKKRADETTSTAAEAMVRVLQRKRRQLTLPLDAEIRHYANIIEYKRTGRISWKAEGKA